MIDQNKLIISNSKKRIDKLLKKNNSYNKQKGGNGLRTNKFNSSGSFSNMATQLVYFIQNGVATMVDGVSAVSSIVTLPMDLGHELGKPNEPLPGNTPI